MFRFQGVELRVAECRVLGKWGGGRVELLATNTGTIYRGLNSFNRVPLNGVYKGYYKGSISSGFVFSGWMDFALSVRQFKVKGVFLLWARG